MNASYPGSPQVRAEEKVYVWASGTSLNYFYSGCHDHAADYILSGEHITQKPHRSWVPLKAGKALSE